jgi:hypothetical protein
MAQKPSRLRVDSAGLGATHGGFDYKEQFIETGTMMERDSFRLLAADEKSPVKY